MDDQTKNDAQEGELLTPIPREEGQAITMDFPDAIKELINGKKIKRISWPTQTDHCLLKDGWLSIHTKGAFHTWNVNDGDLESRDWIVIGELNG